MRCARFLQNGKSVGNRFGNSFAVIARTTIPQFYCLVRASTRSGRRSGPRSVYFRLYSRIAARIQNLACRERSYLHFSTTDPLIPLFFVQILVWREKIPL